MYDESIREKLLQEKNKYYGEVIFEMVYKSQFSDLIHWLFVDFTTLESYAKDIGLKCELVKKGYHHDFLVKMIVQ